MRSLGPGRLLLAGGLVRLRPAAGGGFLAKPKKPKKDDKNSETVIWFLSSLHGGRFVEQRTAGRTRLAGTEQSGSGQLGQVTSMNESVGHYFPPTLPQRAAELRFRGAASGGDAISQRGADLRQGKSHVTRVSPGPILMVGRFACPGGPPSGADGAFHLRRLGRDFGPTLSERRGPSEGDVISGAAGSPRRMTEARISIPGAPPSAPAEFGRMPKEGNSRNHFG